MRSLARTKTPKRKRPPGSYVVHFLAISHFSAHRLPALLAAFRQKAAIAAAGGQLSLLRRLGRALPGIGDGYHGHRFPLRPEYRRGKDPTPQGTAAGPGARRLDRAVPPVA